MRKKGMWHKQATINWNDQLRYILSPMLRCTSSECKARPRCNWGPTYKYGKEGRGWATMLSRNNLNIDSILSCHQQFISYEETIQRILRYNQYHKRNHVHSTWLHKQFYVHHYNNIQIFSWFSDSQFSSFTVLFKYHTSGQTFSLDKRTNLPNNLLKKSSRGTN